MPPWFRAQPWLQRVLSLHDTCGVNNLHGMPGVLSGLLSIAFAASANADTFSTPAQLIAAYGPRFADGVEVRSSGQQALAQFLGLITSFVIALVTGAATGSLAKFAGKLESRSEDSLRLLAISEPNWSSLLLSPCKKSLNDSYLIGF